MAEPALSAWLTRDLSPADGPAMRALFAEVFGKPMSEALWHWKYANDAGHGTGVWRGDELVAHYGGMGRDILYFGESGRAVQITDVMVKSAGRSSVRRNSPFYLAGKTFLETWIGYERPYLLGFGFPSDRHMALAHHLGLYAPVGRMVESVWDTTTIKASPWTSTRILGTSPTPGTSSDPRTSLPAEGEPSFPGMTGISRSTVANRDASTLDTLWRSLATDLATYIVAVKNTSFLEQRYLRHPEHRYTLHLVRHRLTRKTLGLVALRDMEDHCLLMDVIGPLARLPALLRAAIAQTARAGKPCLKTWCSLTFAPLFQQHGARQQELPITTPTNILTPGPAPEGLRDKWWLMPGDTDFL